LANRKTADLLSAARWVYENNGVLSELKIKSATF